MVPSLECDEGVAPGIVFGQLEGHFHRIRACGSSKLDSYLFHSWRHHRLYLLYELQSDFCGEVQGMSHFLLLLLYCCHHRRIIVSHSHDSCSSKKIDEYVTIHIFYGGTLPFFHDHRYVTGIGNSTSFHGLLLAEQAEGTWTGECPNLWGF